MADPARFLSKASR